MPVNIEKTNAGFGIIRHNLEQKLRESAAELFHPEGVDIWMEHPNRMLAGQTPLDAAKTKAGFLRAEAILDALKDGAVF